MSAIPSGGESDMKSDLQEMETIRAEGGSMNGKPPAELSPQEMHAKLWAILTIRDRSTLRFYLSAWHVTNSSLCPQS